MTDPSTPPLAGRRVVLGVSGGIAAYKAVELCRRLVDAGAFVSPVLTADARRFVGAATFSALASEPVRASLFDAPEPIPHTHLGQGADLVVVAPATAKVIGKYASGISDDLLTATLLATVAPVMVAPAMHTEMWQHPAVQDNLERLRSRGVTVVPPERGVLAGGDVGEGRLADPAVVFEAAVGLLGRGPLAGRHLLVTAGGTRERIDPVRFVGNRSSGRMGHAVADVAARRGARVTLVSTTRLPTAAGVETVGVETAEEMRDAVLEHLPASDALVMAAAPADFRPKSVAEQKIKKADGAPEILLEPTPDILEAVGSVASGQFVVGFAAETERLREHAEAKLAAKGVDLMVANDVAAADSGFDVDTNRALLLGAGGNVDELPLMTKHELAGVILERVAAALEASDDSRERREKPDRRKKRETPA